MGNLKLFLTDCDGVLTDGGMYYFESGDEAKKFNTKDGMAFKILKDRNIKIGIITGENSKIVVNRAKKLKMDFVFINVKDKILVVDELLKKLKIDYQDVGYVGDDINDLEVLKKVGFSACPLDAVEKVLQTVKYVSNKKGGCGVIRDIVDNLFGDENE